MNFILVGTNHKTSPIEIRERISFSKKRLKDALSLLKESKVLKGAVILSTCNRIEIYSTTEDALSGIQEIQNFIAYYHEIDKQKFLSYLYIYQGKEAIRHLFLVACGLDSLILGETEILGQVKQAFFEAQELNFTDEFLKEIFYSAIYATCRIRKFTGICQGKISVGSVAIDFIKERVGSLFEKNILIIGVGKVTELVLKYLKKENPKVVFVSNRTFQKARTLAEAINAEAIRFDNLKECLKKADVVITATSSPHFVIKKETLENVVNHKLLIIDLGLPRNVEPRVRELEKIELFSLEDLGQTIQKNLEKRKIESEKAKSAIDKEAERIWERLTKLAPERVPLP